MKKLLFALLAVAMIAGCKKEDKVYTQNDWVGTYVGTRKTVAVNSTDTSTNTNYQISVAIDTTLTNAIKINAIQFSVSNNTATANHKPMPNGYFNSNATLNENSISVTTTEYNSSDEIIGYEFWSGVK